MADFLKDELGNIAYVLCYGGLLACIYDIIKCIRHFIRHNIVAVSVEDMLFWFMASLFTLKLTIELNDGDSDCIYLSEWSLEQVYITRQYILS